MSILKQSHESLRDNRKQSSSFGSWYTYPLDKLTIIILTDAFMADGTASQMLKTLDTDLSNSFPELPSNPNFQINRTEMENVVRNLCETYGRADDKIYKAKQTLTSTTNVMRNNIGSMIHNSNKLEDIENASSSMRSAAHLFSTKGKLLEEKMKRRNRMLMLAIGAIVLFLIIIVIFYFS